MAKLDRACVDVHEEERDGMAGRAGNSQKSSVQNTLSPRTHLHLRTSSASRAPSRRSRAGDCGPLWLCQIGTAPPGQSMISFIFMCM